MEGFTWQAQAIITNDLDLLTLGEFQGIPILTCADFLNPYFNKLEFTQRP